MLFFSLLRKEVNAAWYYKVIPFKSEWTTKKKLEIIYSIVRILIKSLYAKVLCYFLLSTYNKTTQILVTILAHRYHFRQRCMLDSFMFKLLRLLYIIHTFTKRISTAEDAVSRFTDMAVLLSSRILTGKYPQWIFFSTKNLQLYIKTNPLWIFLGIFLHL